MKKVVNRSQVNPSKPLVSVVMPNYNTPEPYLRRAIESVLAQTYPAFELIIIDDASTGDDVAIIQSYHDSRIVLLRNETNRHVAYTLNRGLDIAKGAYIARMDSDDICLPRRIEKQVAFLQRHHEIDILCAQARKFGARSGVIASHMTNASYTITELFFGCPIVHPTVMFRASFIRQHALRYQDSLDYRAAEDYELWSRCAWLGSIREYPRIVLEYRVHDRQVSAASDGLQHMGTRRVRATQLERLGIVPDEREALMHDRFCSVTLTPDFALPEIERWALRLLEANERLGAFPRRFFSRSVIQRFFVMSVKALLSRQTTFGELVRLGLMRRALSPILYFGYFRRFLFSKRLNRVI